jgi:hypothetical protein
MQQDIVNFNRQYCEISPPEQGRRVNLKLPFPMIKTLIADLSFRKLGIADDDAFIDFRIWNAR